MKRAVTILCVVLFLPVVFVSCSGANSKEVVAVEKTGTYHRPECPLVKMARIKIMTVAEARAEHLKPCTACKPDTL
jgi:methylphosphotriester-DNA--protein-cysteine methyltransferase